MMNDCNAKDVVVSGKIFPDLFFGDVGFKEFMVWMGTFGFFEKFSADVQPGVSDIFWESNKQSAITATHIKNFKPACRTGRDSP